MILTYPTPGMLSTSAHHAHHGASRTTVTTNTKVRKWHWILPTNQLFSPPESCYELRPQHLDETVGTMQAAVPVCHDETCCTFVIRSTGFNILRLWNERSQNCSQLSSRRNRQFIARIGNYISFRDGQLYRIYLCILVQTWRLHLPWYPAHALYIL